MVVHENSVAHAQLVLDQVIEIVDRSPLLNDEEKLAFIHEMRTVLDNAEERLRSDPDRLFHADGHDDRMNHLKPKISAGRGTKMNCMLHDDPVFDSFLHDAYSSYGDKGLYEAKKVVKKYEATPHEPEDAGFIKEAFIQTFWDAMAYKQKHQ